MKISNKFVKYLYLLITFAMVGGSSCETFETFNKISASFDGAKPNIGVVSTKDTSSISPVPITFTSPAAVTPVSSNYQLNPAKCDLFTDLVANGFDVIFVDAKNGAAQNSGESWAKAVPSVKEAINMVTVKLRSDKIKNGNAVKPAFIAIAGGNYEYDNENNVGGSVGARSEIISLYGQVVQAYSNMYIYGGFKNGDKCSSVERNDSTEDPYNANDPARQTVIDAQNKASVIAINEPGVNKVRFSHLTLRNGDAKTVGGRTEKANGGAISLRADKLNEIIFNKIKIDGANKAEQNGGCVSVIGKDIKNINFTNSNFSGCEALAGNGGGVYVKVTMSAPDPDANIKISGTNIAGNKAPAGNGGGIYLGSDTYAGFDGIKVTANEAKLGGGIASVGKAFFNTQNAGNEIASNSITQNAGAGIYINNTTKKDYILEGLKVATSSSSYMGKITGLGVYVNNAANVSFKTTEVSDNTTTKETLGVIYLENNTKVSFTALTCDKNTSGNAASKGGCLYSTTPTQLIFDPAKPTKITNNVSGDGGGLYIANARLDNLVNVTFTGNTAKSNGGGLYIANARLDNLTNITCTGNKAASDGACMYLENNITTGKLNSAAPPAMIVSIVNPLNINSLTCEKNEATQNGGCIASNKSLNFADFTCGPKLAKDTVSGNKIPGGNTAGHSGGCISSPGNSATLSFANVTCINNQATAGNGGCLSSGTSDLKVDQSSKFEGNEAIAGSGGAIYASAPIRVDKFYKTLFKENKAKNGGALYFNQAPRLTIKNVRFENNKAVFNAAANNGGNGGAIYFAKGWTSFDPQGDDPQAKDPAPLGIKRKFTGRGMVDDVNTYGTCPIYDAFGNKKLLSISLDRDYIMNLFLKNQASNNGGAIYVDSGAITPLNNSVFKTVYQLTGETYTKHTVTQNVPFYEFNIPVIFNGNKAQNGDGGAVCFNHNNNNWIDTINGIYENNEALNGRGGAVYFSDKIQIDYIESTYTSNKAKFGGAIAILGSLGGNIGGLTKFINNEANDSGGAVYMQTFISGHTLFADYTSNSATNLGGAIYVVDAANGGITFNGRYEGNNAGAGSGVVDFSDATAAHLVFKGDYIANNPKTTNRAEISTIKQNIDKLTLIGNFEGAKNALNTGDGRGFNLEGVTTEISIKQGSLLDKISNYQTLADGGFMYLRTGNDALSIDIKDISIVDNKARNGGAFYLNTIGTMSIMQDRGETTNNKATENGGVFYVSKMDRLTIWSQYDSLFSFYTRLIQRITGTTKYQRDFTVQKRGEYEKEAEIAKAKFAALLNPLFTGLDADINNIIDNYFQVAIADKDDFQHQLDRAFLNSIDAKLNSDPNYASMTATEQSNAKGNARNEHYKYLVDNNLLNDLDKVYIAPSKLSPPNNPANNQYVVAQRYYAELSWQSKFYLPDASKYLSTFSINVFGSNEAGENGGILYTDSITNDFNLNNQLVRGNKAKNGAGFYVNEIKGNLNVKEVSTYQNGSTENGGVFWVNSVNNVTFDGSSPAVIAPKVNVPYFKFSEYDGTTVDKQIKLISNVGNNSSFTRKDASGKNLMISLVFGNKDDVSDFNNTISQYEDVNLFLAQDNRAEQGGGVGYFGDVKGNFTLTNMSLANNQAFTGGGAFYINNLTGNVNYNPASNILLNTDSAVTPDAAGIVVNGPKAAESKPARKN